MPKIKGSINKVVPNSKPINKTNISIYSILHKIDNEYEESLPWYSRGADDVHPIPSSSFAQFLKKDLPLQNGLFVNNSTFDFKADINEPQHGHTLLFLLIYHILDINNVWLKQIILKLFQLLLERGADPNICSYDQNFKFEQSPLTLLLDKIEEYRIEQRNIKNQEKKAANQFIVNENELVDMLNLLLKHGADFSKRLTKKSKSQGTLLDELEMQDPLNNSELRATYYVVLKAIYQQTIEGRVIFQLGIQKWIKDYFEANPRIIDLIAKKWVPNFPSELVAHIYSFLPPLSAYSRFRREANDWQRIIHFGKALHQQEEMRSVVTKTPPLIFSKSDFLNASYAYGEVASAPSSASSSRNICRIL